MKKLLQVITIISFLISLSAFANQSGYFSSKHPLTGQSVSLKGDKTQAPTQITIFNATNNTIYVNVPAGNFTDPIYPHESDIIYNYNGAFNTRIVLLDPYHYSFFNAIVCPRAFVNVYGYSYNQVVVNNGNC